jgi:hypothetical protein
MKITRMSLAALAAVASLFAMAGPAQADPPQAVLQDPVNLPGTNTAGNDGFCPFPVRIDVTTNQKTTKTTKNPDGSTSSHSAGFATATVTRTDTGKSLTYKISGPGTFTVFPDKSFTIDATGQNLLYTTVANSFDDVPRLSYTTGHVKVAVNAAGLTTDYSLSGRRTDVCAALA